MSRQQEKGAAALVMQNTDKGAAALVVQKTVRGCIGREQGKRQNKRQRKEAKIRARSAKTRIRLEGERQSRVSRLRKSLGDAHPIISLKFKTYVESPSKQQTKALASKHRLHSNTNTKRQTKALASKHRLHSNTNTKRGKAPKQLPPIKSTELFATDFTNNFTKVSRVYLFEMVQAEHIKECERAAIWDNASAEQRAELGPTFTRDRELSKAEIQKLVDALEQNEKHPLPLLTQQNHNSGHQ